MKKIIVTIKRYRKNDAGLISTKLFLWKLWLVGNWDEFYFTF